MIKKQYIALTLIALALSYFSSCTSDSRGESWTGKVSEKTKELLPGLKAQKLSPQAYENWVEKGENGLSAKKTIGIFTYSALYKPYEYLALKEFKKDTVSENTLKQKIKEYEGYQYFTYRIAAKGSNDELLKVNLKSQQEYYDRLAYFSFNMQNDFKLIENKDTLDCVLYHYERVYGLAPYATLVLGFPNGKKVITEKKLLYEDKVFGSGNVYLTFTGEKLKSIPQIEFNN